MVGAFAARAGEQRERDRREKGEGGGKRGKGRGMTARGRTFCFCLLRGGFGPRKNPTFQIIIHTHSQVHLTHVFVVCASAALGKEQQTFADDNAMKPVFFIGIWQEGHHICFCWGPMGGGIGTRLICLALHSSVGRSVGGVFTVTVRSSIFFPLGNLFLCVLFHFSPRDYCSNVFTFSPPDWPCFSSAVLLFGCRPHRRRHCRCFRRALLILPSLHGAKYLRYVGDLGAEYLAHLHSRTNHRFRLGVLDLLTLAGLESRFEDKAPKFRVLVVCPPERDLQY